MDNNIPVMSGRPKDVEDGKIVWEMFRRPHPGFVATEVADFVDMSRQGVYNRLVDMEELGLVDSKQPGRDRVWWVTEAGAQFAQEWYESGNQGTQ